MSTNKRLRVMNSNSRKSGRNIKFNTSDSQLDGHIGYNCKSEGEAFKDTEYNNV